MHPHQTLVREFHERFGLTINDTPTPAFADLPLRHSLHREEYLETLEADTRIKYADGLADLRYVLLGSAVTFGITPKPDEAPKGRIRDIEDHLDRAIGWFNTDAQCSDLDGTACSLWCALACIDALADWHGIPLDAVFTEVHRSNMSKLWTDAEAAVMAHELAHSDDPSKLTLTQVSKTDERGWLVKRADGKALKSPSYSPADIAGILARN